MVKSYQQRSDCLLCVEQLGLQITIIYGLIIWPVKCQKTVFKNDFKNLISKDLIVFCCLANSRKR